MAYSTPRILLMDEVHPLIPNELTHFGFQCDFFPDATLPDFREILGDYTGVIIRSRVVLDEALLKRGDRLRFIGRVGAGMEGIDLAYAQRRGIRCFNSPEGNRDAVGEHALGMILALMNKMAIADRQIRQGIWQREPNRGWELGGKTVGIIGYGNMGSAFARRLKGFGVTTLSWDKYKTGYSDGNTREVTLREVMEEADVLSLHVPLTSETRGMVNESFIAGFGKPFWLINTSRGAVVPTGSLVSALKEGKILGAALDVLEQEDASFARLSQQPDEAFRYLLSAENVLLTPHVAGWTVESKEKLAAVLVEKILIFARETAIIRFDPINDADIHKK